MKIKCLVGLHKWKRMPWMKTQDRSPRPGHACPNCGKIKYDWNLYISSPETSFLSSLGPQYEGQSPPSEYKSWEEYYGRIEIAKIELMRRAK